MVVEIDQSGRLEDLNTDTVIAFSNSKSRMVIIKVVEKRKIINYLSKLGFPHRQTIPVIFATCIYLMIKKHIKDEVLLIDEEYTGKNNVISKTLNNLFRKNDIDWKADIRFGRIGKSSPAHLLAWTTHRKHNRSAKLLLDAKTIIEEIKTELGAHSSSLR